jgi:hypothetical protein
MDSYSLSVIHGGIDYEIIFWNSVLMGHSI